MISSILDLKEIYLPHKQIKKNLLILKFGRLLNSSFVKITRYLLIESAVKSALSTSCSVPCLTLYPSGGSKELWAEFSYILAELFNKCLKQFCFVDYWKVSSVVLIFKNVGERSAAKNYCPVILLSVVSKVFEKLVNNRIVDYLEKCGVFSSTADLLLLYLMELLGLLTGLGLLEL